MPKRDQTQQSQDFDDDSSKDQQKMEVRRPKIQRLDKFKNLKKIVINVSMTQYPVVSQIAEQLNWKIQTNHEQGDWDIFWTDYAIDPDILIRMHLFQKINHFPGVHLIARKNLLGLGLMSMRSKVPQQYNFFPLTWMLPSQYAQFRAYYQNRQKGKCRTYIVKPEAECQGRGIFLTRKLQDLQNGKHYVVQRYIARPYLIDGLKFDFRIYVLLCGTDPLKLFIYHQGLARFATQKYVQPCSANLDKQYVHLTNYAINKHNPKFIFNTNASNMSIGHKRSLTCVYKQLAAKGIDIQSLKAKINDMAIKTIITGLPLMSHQYKYSQPQDYYGNMCFHILGLDIMLNNKGDPFLIQVNHTPSFTTDTPLDYQIKHNLIKDTLILMNINAKKKNQLYQRCKQYNQQRLLTGKRHIFQGAQRQKLIAQAQKEREEWQVKHLGGYQRIYPTDNPQINKKYQDLIKIAKATYFEQNTSFRMKMQQKQAKRLIKNDIKKFREVQKKENLQASQSPTPNNKTKPNIAKSLPQQHKKPNQSYKNVLTNTDQLIKSQIQMRDKLHGNISDKFNNSIIKDRPVSRVKNKHINSHMGKRPHHNELPNLQQNGIVSNLIKEPNSSIYNKSDISNKHKPHFKKSALIIRKQQTNSTKQARVQHKTNLHSQPKNVSKMIDSMTRQLKQYSQKKNGGYVMPKIFCLNFEIDRKMDLNFLTMNKKIQSAHFAQQQ